MSEHKHKKSKHEKKENGSHTKKERKKRRTGGFCKFLKIMFLYIFGILRYYFDLLVDKCFAICYNSYRQYVPSGKNAIINESAVSLARKIRKRELKVEEVVEAFIERIKNVNGIVNAIVDDRFIEALEEAKKLDKDIESGVITDVEFDSKPFLGVPFTTKESTSCKGLSNTFSLQARKDKKGEEDAEVVHLMKKAGGILLGVTNVPPLNLWMESTNLLFGTTKNPYNTTRNCGGSSGGESSVLAVGGSPIGIGSDIGGSIRLPCAMCGIFGHKPTLDLISTRGLTFRTGTECNTMVAAGPMTRYAEDLIPLMKVLLGTNVNKLKLNQPVDLNKVNIYYVTNPNDPYVSPFREEVNEIMDKVVSYFEDTYEKPKLVEFEGLRYGGKLWRYWMTQEPNANFKKDITNRKREVVVWQELIKFLIRNSEFSLSVILNLINSILPAENARWATELTEKLQQEITDQLGDNGVLLFPSFPFPASYHNASFLRPWNINLFCVWNALKLPVTQVPLGLGSEGLPLGIQIVTTPFNDHLSLAVASELEKQFGGYIPPYTINDESNC